MPCISNCPKCRRPVTIPDGLSPQAEVRCPLCVAVFPLDEAMADLPPSLVPVDTGGISGGPSGSAATSQANLISEPYHVPEKAKTDTEPPAGQGPAIDAWKKVDATPQIDTGQAPAAADAAAGFDLQEPQDDRRPLDGTLAGPPRRRKKKEKSALRFMVEVIGGGFFGLLIGYYLLCWLGGDRLGLPKLPLPWLPHTMQSDEKSETQRPPADKNDKGPLETPPEKPTVDPGTATDAGAKTTSQPNSQPLPDDYVGPRDPPLLNSDDLGAALKVAFDANSGLGEVDAMTAEVHAEFCRLARAITFVASIPGDDRLRDRVEYVKKMLDELAVAPGRVNQVGRLAGEILGDDAAEGGILLAGTAGPVRQSGKLHGTVVKLAAHDESISVLSNEPLPFSADRQVLILGSIVNHPAENLAGYDGPKAQVVWLGMAVVVPED